MADQSSHMSASLSGTSPYNALNSEKDSHDVQQLTDQQQEMTEAEKKTANAKKRKEMAPRSEVWHHFTKVFEGDVLKTATCNYCKSELACVAKRNGTSSMLKHLTTCKKNPHRVNDDKQPTLQATPNQADPSKCSITAWRFDQDKLKDALAEMAVALDPRYKLSNYIKIATFEMFGEINGEEVWTKMNTTLTNMFKEYLKLYGPTEQEVQPDDAPSLGEDSSESLMSSLIAKRMRMNDCGISISPSKSELEKYLAEDNEAHSSKFNILDWWKVNSSRFPVLSRLARDVLAFPISTVASESAFSTGGRILDDFRSSLTPFMVQALICTQDWLRREIPVNNEEDTELLANLEQAILQELSESSTSASVRITIDDTES